MSADTSPLHSIPFDVPSVEEMSALLPQYEFEKLAAFGGMGAVYKARQASLDRPVAVKILPPSFGAEQDFAERFKSEARAMARLNHTHIVAVYDFGITTEGHLYLVMEWVEGLTIHELIQKGTIPVRKVANLAIQLCDALYFAHSHKILHRDIKPGNIMVNEDDQVKVADFGLARPITGEAEENPFGTPDYAAPEIMAKAAVDQRADIFAAGIVLYEMLTGRVPRQPRRSVTEFSPVSTRWDEVIAKAIDPNPELRYQDVRDFRTGIMMAISQSSGAPLPVAMRVEEPIPVAAPAFSPVKVVAIAAVLIAGIVGGFMALQSDGDPKAPNLATGASEPPKSEIGDKEPVEEKQANPEKTASTPDKAPETAPTPPMPEKSAVVVAPAPEPMKPADSPLPMAPKPPSGDDAKAFLAALEKDDPEIIQLIAGFTAEWEANAEVNTRPARKELANKYIPALQRSLTGLPVDQRDHVLSEISLVANSQPLHDPAETWPDALKQLRKTYDDQISAIEGKAATAATAVRAAQSAAVTELAQKRAAAGDSAGAKRAELVAAALSKLKGPPSVEAIQETGGTL